MNWWKLLVELFALGLTVVVGTIVYLLNYRKGYSVEAAASLESIRRAGPSAVSDRKGA